MLCIDFYFYFPMHTFEITYISCRCVNNKFLGTELISHFMYVNMMSFCNAPLF